MEPISRHLTEKLVSKIEIISTFVTYEQYHFMNSVISVEMRFECYSAYENTSNCNAYIHQNGLNGKRLEPFTIQN